MLRICYLLLCLVAGSQQLTITDFAVPSAVLAGENAELQCRYSLGDGDPGTTLLFVKWWFTPLNGTSEERKMLYQRIVDREPQVNQENITIKENDTIELVDLEPKNSGTYECEVSLLDEIRQHQELIVYSKGTGPQLNILTVADGPDEDEEEDVLVTCAASGVAPQPDISITVDGELVSISELITEPEDGLYDITANATVSMDRADGAEIRCELFYKNENISHPAYIDTEIYDPSGTALSTTESPGDGTESDVASESFQRTTDGGNHLSSSWTFLLAVSIPMHLFALLL